MAGIYTLGNIDSIVRPLASWAGTMGRRQAEEAEAERKRKEAAEKARLLAEANAYFDTNKVTLGREKAGHHTKQEKWDVDKFRTSAGHEGAKKRFHDDIQQKKARAEETLLKLDRAGVDKAITRAKAAAADADYEDSYDASQTGDGRLAPDYYNPAKESMWKRDETRRVEEKKARAAGIKSYKAQVKADLAAKVAARKAEGAEGPHDQWNKARGAAGHHADEFFGSNDIVKERRAEIAKAERIRQLKTIRGFDSEAHAIQQRIDAEESKQPPIVAAAESARIRLKEQAGAVGDYPFDTLEINKERKEIAALEAVIAKKQQAAAVLEEKRRKAEYIQKQKNEAAIEKARFLDNQTLGITDARRNALLKDEVVAFGDTELTLKTILDKAIRDKAYTERVVEPEELSLFDKLKARAGGDVRVVPDFKDVRRIVSQDRATAMGEKLTPDVMRNVGDVSTQAANQIALSMYGPNVSATQVKDVLKRIDRLVEDGAITLVNVTGIGDSMQVHAVTVDKLKEQLQDHMPGYVDSGENPVRRIGGRNGVGGVLVEYNPVLKKYYVLSSLAGTFSKGNMGIRF
jgi:hypothetical protein